MSKIMQAPHYVIYHIYTYHVVTNLSKAKGFVFFQGVTAYTLKLVNTVTSRKNCLAIIKSKKFNRKSKGFKFTTTPIHTDSKYIVIKTNHLY